jgi:hypothetical protein
MSGAAQFDLLGQRPYNPSAALEGQNHPARHQSGIMVEISDAYSLQSKSEVTESEIHMNASKKKISRANSLESFWWFFHLEVFSGVELLISGRRCKLGKRGRTSGRTMALILNPRLALKTNI